MEGVGTEYGRSLKWFTKEECAGCKATEKRLNAMGPDEALKGSLYTSQDVVMRFYTIYQCQWLYFVPGAHWFLHFMAWVLLFIAIRKVRKRESLKSQDGSPEAEA